MLGLWSSDQRQCRIKVSRAIAASARYGAGKVDLEQFLIAGVGKEILGVGKASFTI